MPAVARPTDSAPAGLQASNGALPGKPQGIAFKVLTFTPVVDALVKISPGSPVLPLTAGAATVLLKRQGDCAVAATSWSCRYLSDDGLDGLTIRFLALAPDTYVLKDLKMRGTVVPADDIYRSLSPSGAEDSDWVPPGAQ